MFLGLKSILTNINQIQIIKLPIYYGSFIINYIQYCY